MILEAASRNNSVLVTVQLLGEILRHGCGFNKQKYCDWQLVI
jgi:hypothetical protein